MASKEVWDDRWREWRGGLRDGTQGGVGIGVESVKGWRSITVQEDRREGWVRDGMQTYDYDYDQN